MLSDPAALYLAIGIVGATVMPHNLYLHSSLVQSRAYPRSLAGKRKALRWAVADSSLALTLALLVNAAILIVAASVFHRNGHRVVDIEQAHAALAIARPGTRLAAVRRGAARVRPQLDGHHHLAGQIVMEGFLRLRLAPWARRLLTVASRAAGAAGDPALRRGWHRAAADLQPGDPVDAVAAGSDPAATVRFRPAPDGPLAIGAGTRWLAWAVALAIVGLNLQLLADFAFG